MSGSYVIWLEMEEARSKLLDIKWLRVTLPIAPERLRHHSLKAYPDGTVDHDPQTTDCWREIVVHPKDWLEIRAESQPRPVTHGTVFGLPVI